MGGEQLTCPDKLKFAFEGGCIVIPSEARPKAEPGSNGGLTARSCDLGAKRPRIGTAKVKKKF